MGAQHRTECEVTGPERRNKGRPEQALQRILSADRDLHCQGKANSCGRLHRQAACFARVATQQTPPSGQPPPCSTASARGRAESSGGHTFEPHCTHLHCRRIQAQLLPHLADDFPGVGARLQGQKKGKLGEPGPSLQVEAG